MNFKGIDIRVPASFIRDGSIEAYTKMIVLVELSYNLALAGSGYCKKYPTQSEISEYIGVCRQTVSKYQKKDEYIIYSPRHGARISKRSNDKFNISARLVTARELSIYERLMLININIYIFEGFDCISMAQLGRELGASGRTMSRYANSLVEKGLIIKSLTQTAEVGAVFNTFEIPPDFSKKLTAAMIKLWAKC